MPYFTGLLGRTNKKVDGGRTGKEKEKKIHLCHVKLIGYRREKWARWWVQYSSTTDNQWIETCLPHSLHVCAAGIVGQIRIWATVSACGED